MPAPNLSLQIAELRRELVMRKKVYPTWVVQGRLSQREADERMERLLAALGTLNRVLEDSKQPKLL